MLCPSTSLRDHARNEAAVLIQCHWRRALASQLCKEKRAQKKEQQSLAQALVVKTAGEQINCPLDHLTTTVDSVCFIEERIPFLHATSAAAQENLMRCLSYTPGCTLRWRDAEDMKPSRLRAALVSCLGDGLTMVIDLDADASGRDRELGDGEVLLDICGPSHFPVELFEQPRSIFKSQIYGPLHGRVGAKAAEHFELLGLGPEASTEAVRKAYKQIVKTAHPDKGGDPEKFLKIQAAYAALTVGESDGLPDMPEFLPQPGFKLLLVSRQMNAPPADMTSYCTPVWVSDKIEYLIKGYAKPIQATDAFSDSERFDLQLANADADRWHAEFMKGRVYEDDELEVARRVQENRARMMKHRRRLRRKMFVDVSNLPKGGEDADGRCEQAAAAASKCAWQQLETVEEAIRDEARLARLESDAIDTLKKHEKERAFAKSAAKEQLPGLRRQSASKKERLPIRLDLLDKKRAAATAKQAEAQEAAGSQRQLQLETEARELQLAVEQAEDMQNQFEEWVKRLEKQCQDMEEEVECHELECRRLRQQIREKQKGLTEKRLKTQGELLQMTEPFHNEEQELARENLRRTVAEAAEADEGKRRSFIDASLQEVHRAVYMMDEGNSSQLVDAAADGDLDQVMVLLGKGFDLESHDARGFTALSDAACCGSRNIAELLLELGADPNTYSMAGGESMLGTLFSPVLRTPLWRAQFNGHYDIMELLLKHGADAGCLDVNPNLNPKVKEVLAPWTNEKVKEAQEARKRRLERQLEDFSRTWSETDQHAFHVMKNKARLQDLVIKGDAEAVKSLLHECISQHVVSGSMEPPPLYADIRDRVGRTLLHLAAWKGNVEVVEMLVTYWKAAKGNPEDLHQDVTLQVFRVDIDARFGPWNGCSGWTALSIAAFCGHAEVVEVLRQQGANPLLGTGFHEDAFAIANVAPPPSSSACAVVRFIDDDNVIHTARAHGLRSGEEVIYKCEPYSETPMRLILSSSKTKVTNFTHFCVHVVSPTSLILHKVGKAAGLVPRGSTMQRVYSGEGTSLVKVMSAQESMREYLPALTRGGSASAAGFLRDRPPIRASGRNQKTLQDCKRRQDFEIARAVDSACNKSFSNNPGGLALGTWVQLSHSGQDVEEGYDWSNDPLRPGEEGEVIDPDEHEWDDEPDPCEVCVLGPRGEVGVYDPSDLVEVASASAMGKPASLGPRLSSVSSDQKCEPTGEVKPSLQDGWVSERRIVKAEESSFYELKYSGAFT